ncbi:MAG: CAAX protease [Gloeocapsa sp. DLM2.Bin57]|nr:MAG: CAAX protease [Gloeocapsa sp. DLM2.Bin57]
MPNQDLIFNILALRVNSFISLVNSEEGWLISLIVVLLAGISLGLGQGIILFVSRVKPWRFVFSILVNAILFTFGFLFLVFSVWLNCQIPWWSLSIPFASLVQVLGVSYAPQLFSFTGALPYLGVPILSLLSVWRLLAMVVGFSAVAGVDLAESFRYVIIGWLILQLLENTLGKPITSFGRKVSNHVAGTELPRNRKQVKRAIRNEIDSIVNSDQHNSDLSLNQARINNSHQQLKVIKQQDTRLDAKILSLLGMLLLLIVITLALSPLYRGFLAWQDNLPDLFKLIFDLGWIGLIATVFAGFLAPLETLGWWAGWYGDDLEVQAQTEEITEENNYDGYVIYLDGIGQSGSQYTPDVENFLEELKTAIPRNYKLIKGLMMYSVLNKPLDEDRPLAFFWKIVDNMRIANPQAILGIILNLRNVFIVAVSADQRYGPIYNLGIAQTLYNGLVKEGYQRGTPITLIGYSGGGQMSVAVAPYLKKAMSAPVDVISLGGVMSANNNLLDLEQLYHLVGDKDSVERIGPVMFPGRWRIFPLSYWNRAKRRGNISILSLGPVGHQVPGGMMDDQAYLEDGRSYLTQTIEIIIKILEGVALPGENLPIRTVSNYERYQQASWIQPDSYPLIQQVDTNLYHPVGDWVGRLILPSLSERKQVQGAWFEIYSAPSEYQHLIGTRVKLRESDDPFIQTWVKTVTRDVHFSGEAEYTAKYGGLIHPLRLNHWLRVNPIESLAGSRPYDDVVVTISADDLEVRGDCLYISQELIQVTGRFYALVRFLAPLGDNLWKVQHFDPNSRSFTGSVEVVSLPEVIPDGNDCYPSTSKGLEKSPLNEQGWYIYGSKNAQNVFVVMSFIPRVLLKLEPQSLINDVKQGYRFIREQSWQNEIAPKGKIGSVLISGEGQNWQEGDRALVIHVYGGIGGNKREPAAATPIFFGHFAYGLATVIKEPLTGELRFDIVYDQVYTHNTDGLIAGQLHWSRYMGDRQFGWMGTRPVCDLLIKFEPFTGYYNLDGQLVSPLDYMLLQLNVMTARYRIGDGTGGTYVGPANNCAQDSNQALFASIEYIYRLMGQNPEIEKALIRDNPQQAFALTQLQELKKDLKNILEPFGRPRSDWENNQFNLGSTLEDRPLANLWYGLRSWRTMFPRYASDSIVRVFLKYGAQVWVLRTNQIGGNDPDIEAIAPITF